MTKKLLKLINKYSQVAGHKINIQQSVAFLSANNELSERETKKTIPFTISSKTIQYPGINLTKMLKICTCKIIRKTFKKEKTCKIIRKLYEEIEEDTNKWKHKMCSWTEN